MGKQTMKDRVIEWYWTILRKIMNYTLKQYGYDFGLYYMEELEKMYQKHKDEIERE